MSAAKPAHSTRIRLLPDGCHVSRVGCYVVDCLTCGWSDDRHFRHLADADVAEVAHDETVRQRCDIEGCSEAAPGMMGLCEAHARLYDDDRL